MISPISLASPPNSAAMLSPKAIAAGPTVSDSRKRASAASASAAISSR
jgi:hypothetical protein